MRDAEVIEAANRLNLAMVFAGLYGCSSLPALSRGTRCGKVRSRQKRLVMSWFKLGIGEPRLLIRPPMLRSARVVRTEYTFGTTHWPSRIEK